MELVLKKLKKINGFLGVVEKKLSIINKTLAFIAVLFFGYFLITNLEYITIANMQGLISSLLSYMAVIAKESLMGLLLISCFIYLIYFMIVETIPDGIKAPFLFVVWVLEQFEKRFSKEPLATH